MHGLYHDIWGCEPSNRSITSNHGDGTGPQAMPTESWGRLSLNNGYLRHCTHFKTNPFGSHTHTHTLFWVRSVLYRVHVWNSETWSEWLILHSQGFCNLCEKDRSSWGRRSAVIFESEDRARPAKFSRLLPMTPGERCARYFWEPGRRFSRIFEAPVCRACRKIHHGKGPIGWGWPFRSI